MKKGIYAGIVKKMSDLNLDEIVFSQGENYEHYILKNDYRHNVHSISKFVTSLCVGIAINLGFFKDGLDEPILKYFLDIRIDNKRNFEFIKSAKLRHLLTLTLGHGQRLLDSSEIEELGNKNMAEYVLNYPILYEAGTHFVYSSAPFYLLSMMISKSTGLSLLDFAQENLFSKLDISDIDWLKSEEGFSLGCTGLEIKAEDLHKLGKLMLNDGIYKGFNIVPREWINSMRNVHVLSPRYFDKKRALPKYGYGLGLWICENGIYFCDGTDGQYIIIIPNQEMVITTVGNQKEMPIITDRMREILLN